VATTLPPEAYSRTTSALGWVVVHGQVVAAVQDERVARVSPAVVPHRRRDRFGWEDGGSHRVPTCEPGRTRRWT